MASERFALGQMLVRVKHQNMTIPVQLLQRQDHVIKAAVLRRGPESHAAFHAAHSTHTFFSNAPPGS